MHPTVLVVSCILCTSRLPCRSPLLCGTSEALTLEASHVPVLTAAAAAAVEAQKLTTVQQAADKIASMAN